MVAAMADASPSESRSTSAASSARERMSLLHILLHEDQEASQQAARPYSTPLPDSATTPTSDFGLRRAYSLANLMDPPPTPTTASLTESDEESPSPSRSPSPSSQGPPADERSLPDVIEVPNGVPVAKPTLSYSALIEAAILSSPTRRMLLNEIYEWIKENHTYYQYCNKNWKNAIRHNLSLHDCFVKIPRVGHGKGNYWTIDTTRTGSLSSSRRRKAAERKLRMQGEASPYSAPLSASASASLMSASQQHYAAAFGGGPRGFSGGLALPPPHHHRSRSAEMSAKPASLVNFAGLPPPPSSAMQASYMMSSSPVSADLMPVFALPPSGAGALQFPLPPIAPAHRDDRPELQPILPSFAAARPH